MSGPVLASADLWIESPNPASSEERRVVVNARRTTVREICARAGVRYRVTGGHHPSVVLWNGPGHVSTVDCDNHRLYAIDRTGLPQSSGMRALRMLEILAYGFQDYAARESIVGRGYFAYPLTPEHGYAWLAEIGRRGGQARTARKGRSSRRNGRQNAGKP